MDYKVILFALLIIIIGYGVIAFLFKSADWIYPNSKGGRRVKYLNQK